MWEHTTTGFAETRVSKTEESFRIFTPSLVMKQPQWIPARAHACPSGFNHLAAFGVLTWISSSNDPDFTQKVMYW